MPNPFVASVLRDVVLATGPDTIPFLQGQLSQDMGSIPVGGAAWSFLLQPQGKVDAWLRVHRMADEEVRLDVDAGFGDAVIARLQRFKLRTRCDLALGAGIDMLAVRHADVPGGVPCGWPGVRGVDVPGATTGDIAHLGLPDDVRHDDAEAFDAERIRYGVPRMGAEITPDTIPAELGQPIIDLSVSFTKGCFTGQELVARIDSRGGNAPRHLRVFTSERVPPAPGAEVLADGRPVGVVTSSATDASGRTVGLAFIHRSVVPPTDATAGDTPIHVM